MSSRGRSKSFSDRPRSNMTPVEAATRRPDKIEILPVAAIHADPSIQVRVGGLNPEWVENFAVILQSGGELEPIVVFRIGDIYKVADGFHRLAGSIQAGIHDIRCIVKDGTLNDAKEYAELANLEHGLFLSKEDKQNILARWLERKHPNATKSDRELARIFGVTHPTIAAWIDNISTGKNLPVDRSQTTGADGKTRRTPKTKPKGTPPAWTPKRAKTRFFKITATLADDNLFAALNQLEDTERDQVYGQLYDLRKRIDELLGD